MLEKERTSRIIIILGHADEFYLYGLWAKINYPPASYLNDLTV